MAQIVEIIGVTHNPFMARLFSEPEKYPGIPNVKAGFELMRQKLAEARPDVILAIGGDHLNQWFMDNMPAFIIGKSPEARGPFPHEEAEFGIPAYQAKIHQATAKAFLEGGYRRGIDFSFTDEFIIDHSFTLPLAYIRPEQDLPIVPLWGNVMAPPIPPLARFYRVGQVLRSVIEEDLPADLRVAAIASGHLSVEVGGPRMLPATMDRDFDYRAIELVGSGRVEELLAEFTDERLMQAGNVTFGFASYLILVGLAGAKPASHAEGVDSMTNTAPFWAWDLHKDGVP